MNMKNRMMILGAVLAVAGLAVAGVGFLYGGVTAQDGLDSAQAMYSEQGVSLNYNEEGRLVDRGTTEGARAIMSLLRDDYDYPVDMSNFDPDDPVVNTRDELMYQYATITYHVLHGERTVVLAEEDVPITYRGVTYTEAGEYRIAPLAYYAELDRNHPIEGQLREAWSAQALALTSFLAAGHANQAAGELAFATSMGIGAVGLLFAVAGGGIIWVAFAPEARSEARPAAPRDARARRPAREKRREPAPVRPLQRP